MKLIVSELRALGAYVSREFHQVMTDLMTNYDWRQIETFELWNAGGSLKDRLLNRFGEVPNIILFWEGYEFLCAHLSQVSELASHRVIMADDLHWWSEEMRLRKLIAFSSCHAILSTYAYGWARFFPELAESRRPKWVPHSASREFMLDYNPHPANSILLSGVIDRHYPLRQQLKQLQSCYPIYHHGHPGYHCSYDHGTDPNVGRGYGAKINHHRIGFTDSAIYEYVVAKYFEIPATGALLLADDAVRGPLEELGFIQGVHYIAVSKENLDLQIRYVLDATNHEQLDEIRRRGQKLVWDRHKTSDRARQINHLCTQTAAEAGSNLQ